MEEREIVKEYSNADITIVWKAKSCIHAAECVKRLPRVYDPNRKPWIKIENANTKSLIEQIDACPSGALSYYVNSQKEEKKGSESVSVQVLPNGPLIIKNPIKIVKTDGSVEEKDNATAFCRCGASGNKPYCDGSHTKIGFKDE